MARKATAGSTAGGSKAGAQKRSSARKSGSGTGSRALATTGGADDGNSATDAFLKMLQSPIVADLLAVAAMAALTALAEHGFSSRGTGDKRRAGKAMKEAGKAAAAAVGRRLANEVDEIRKAAKSKRGEAA